MSEKRLAKNISMMSVAIFVSRILGLFRDQVMAFFFGTSLLNDAFVVGFKIPNLLRSLFGEGALSASFVPIYNELGIKKDRQEQISFALQVLGILTIFLLILTALGIAFTPLIVKVIYPGLNPETHQLAVVLTRIMFPYLLWIGLSSTMIAILNSHNRFFMTGLSSALLNLGMISALILPRLIFKLESEDLIHWAAWGVFGGGLLQTAINLPYLRKLGYPFKLLVRFQGDAVKAMWTRFIPSLIGVGIREINLIADSLMASFLTMGSISALEYGNRLFQLPLGVFAISTGTVLLPTYSRLVSKGEFPELSRNLKFAAVSLGYVMLPVTTIIFALGGDFVRILFQRGAFDATASLMTQQALVCYAVGLFFFGFNQTLTPIFYANKDTKTPVRIAAAMVGLNIILNYILMQFLQHRGLALSTSITAAVNSVILIYQIRKRIPGVVFDEILPNILKTLVVCVVIFGFLITANRLLPDLNLLLLIIKDFILVAVAFLLFYLLGRLLRLDYLNRVSDLLWKKSLT